MNDHTAIKDKQVTFLDSDRRQVIFTPKKYDPKTGQLIGVNQHDKPIAVAISDFLLPHKPVELDWD
ncbi:MAG: hypothetical protein KDA90_19915 [Planctomycetaceae bacterium]|nr:hypothetical protein [Planctomycetaceae bacterium]